MTWLMGLGCLVALALSAVLGSLVGKVLSYDWHPDKGKGFPDG